MTMVVDARRGEGLRAVAALLVLFVAGIGVPVALVVLGAASDVSLHVSRSTLSSPDDGSLFLGAVLLVSWVAWATFAVSVLVEIVALVRGLPTPSIPTLRLPQQGAAALVATAALILQLGAGQHGSPLPSPVAMAPQHSQVWIPVAVVQPERAFADGPTPAHTTIEVQRHDTLWSIAERHLGSGARYQEIFDLNKGVAQSDGRSLSESRWIYPGWKLRLPAEAAMANDAVHVVRPGESLSEIALAELGSASRAGELFAANEGRAEPGGARLTNPDLIRPGWVLELPGSPRADRPDAALPVPVVATPVPAVVEPAPNTAQPLPEAPTAPAVPVPTAAGSTSSEARPTEVVEAPADPNVGEQAGLVLGTITATGLLMELRRRRRQRQRTRQPGDRIAMPTGAAAELERASVACQIPQTVDSSRNALRALAARCGQLDRPLPDVLLVMLSPQGLRLEMTSPQGEPVDPFVAESDLVWTLGREPVATSVEDPYPALVSLGSSGKEMLLLNLEAVGALHTVDPDGDITRALVADLAIGAFAGSVALCTVDCLSEFARVLDPCRVRVVHSDEQASKEMASRIKGQQDSLASASDLDVRRVRTLTSVDEPLTPEVYVSLGRLSNEAAAWSGVCSIDRVEEASTGWSVVQRAGGEATLEPLGRAFEPSRLTVDQLTELATLLGPEADSVNSVPRHRTAERLAVAAALPDVPAAVLDLRPEAAAPPRVLLLGRVEVENANDEAAPHRRRRASELVAYLALHPGASGREIDEALWPGKRVEKTTRNPFVSRARQWLGRNAEGEPYLPLVVEGGSYQLRPEVACDWHDFVRFSKFGLDGEMPTASALAAALELVRGRPFLGVDPATYTWAEADVQEMISAIVDVAHVLAELRLAEGDFRGAKMAVATGLLVEPCSEVLYRDALRAAIAVGDRTEIQRLGARLRTEIALIDPDEGLDDETLKLLQDSASKTG